jgi:spore coat polysaccharide biosynthesis predicted glycosyltransferase SpsG
MVQDLYFKYDSTARIKFKRKNVFKNDMMPGIYRIKTEKLDFVIPDKLVMLEDDDVFIPNAFYQRVLEKLYFQRAGM